METVIEHLKRNRPLTTFEISKICGVTLPTVANWINQGKLIAYKTPGKHRRVSKEHLVLFMKLYEIVLREYIGEREWTHYLLVNSRTQETAEKKANQYAKKFWASWEDRPARKNEDGQYEFAGGEVVEVLDIRETTKEKFLNECFERAVI